METDTRSGTPGRPRRLRRAAAPLATLALAVLLAGCGTASSGSTGTGTTAGTTTTSTNEFNPNLVPAGGSSPGTPPKAVKTKSGKKSSSKPGSKSGQSKPSGIAGPTNGGSAGGGSGSVAGPGTSGGGTQTVTVTHTSTVTHTVTQTKYVHLRPNVPSGAGLPSRFRALSVSSFDAAGGNIGCRIANGTVRCDVARRVWSAPRKPRSCHSAWAQGLVLGSSGTASFVCARDSVLDPTGTYIHPGYDDKVGSVTCQVRSFGVTCFESDGHGFFIGRTGYTRF